MYRGVCDDDGTFFMIVFAHENCKVALVGEAGTLFSSSSYFIMSVNYVITLSLCVSLC